MELFGRNVRSDLPGRFSEVEMLQSHFDRIAAVNAGQMVPPYEVLIHPSSGCNLSCVWCIGEFLPIEKRDGGSQALQILDASKDAAGRLPSTLADPAAMMSVVEGVVGYEKHVTWSDDRGSHERTFGIDTVSFSGLIGEPLVAKRSLVPAIHFLADHGKRVGLFTNAVLADQNVREALIRCDYIQFSLDAGTSETYSKLKHAGGADGQQAFNAALENFSALAESVKSSGSSLALNSSFIMYPENHHELFEGARLLKEAGARTLRLKQDNSASRPLNPEQQEVATRELQRVRAELEDERFTVLAIHDPANLPETARHFGECQITKFMAAIGSDGELYPCNYHPRPGGFTLGSAITTPFGEVWESESRTSMYSCLPGQCPPVCDPFKGRANNLLEPMLHVMNREGTTQVARQLS